MKLVAGLVASVALFGGAHFLDGSDGQGMAVETAAAATTYRLTANGDEAACVVQRGASVSGGLTLLDVAPDCRSLMPGIERVKFWREQADGSVAFSENGVDPIVTFGVADGDGYESYAPAVPLLALNNDE
ncbi:hypothetical protein [Mesorhizobium australafricanum]|uniref:Alkaline proteinase inhibitor/ Outer membrane lipoprotein Omp19 domain-containing protein n=1 Tax=Mesorhizobium australafricanum TaxID=3072311 RepID=A0ABU4WWB2_9HYPH|nr:hypothetical protein [Mesorhizobium sp. VK3E]MDX8439089.1 hypothetical protein [Mesorhizobium sp. VK3E]